MYIIMKKILILIISLIFTIGCSNLEKKEFIANNEKEELVHLINSIKTELQEGKTLLLEKSLISNMKNKYVKEEIQNIDFSNINIFNSKPRFIENRASNIVGFNFQSMTIYYDVDYLYKNGEWKITKFKERRGE